MKALAAVGVTHRSAPVAVREAFALDREGRLRAMDRVSTLQGVREVVVLSTCNRTEVFAAGDLAGAGLLPQDEIRDALLDVAAGRGSFSGDLRRAVRILRGGDAVRHILALPAGLDSMVLGETQILGQTKRAFDEAVAAGRVGRVFHRLFARAFHLAKWAHEKTALSRGEASVGAMAVALAAKVFGDLSRCTALLVGAGETGRTIAAALARRSVGRIWVASRTLERAEEAAREVGASALPLEVARRRLDEADLVLLAARPREGEWILRRADAERVVSGRKGRPWFVVDVGLPRNADPSIADLRDTYLYSIDDLETLTERNRRRRAREAALVMRRVEDEAERFQAWCRRTADTGAAIEALRRRIEDIGRRELHHALKGAPPEAAPALERLSERLVKRIVQQPASRLRGADGDVRPYVEALTWLFDLEGHRGSNGRASAGANVEAPEERS